DEIIHILAYSEVSIDYAEEDLPEDLVLQIEAKLEDLRKSLQKTLQASRAREGLMQGFRVAIVGKPNVGKSSLLNALLNYNRAIVSDIAGTTRDTIEEQVKVGTHLIRIVDTAGIRESGDEIERIGIERSIEAIKESDIVVALFDASRATDSEDEQMLLLIKSYACDKHVIYLKNKIDLEQKFSHAEIKFDIELNSKESVDPLVGALENIMNSANSSDEMMLISQRQISAVEYTLKNIEESFFPLRDQELEIFSFHLNEAVKEIASITRPFENDEMLEKMFGSFCLGK
ncbi:MAG: GTPase, partial [Sulfurimonas sp.]|nr:GTPase [Sulfurimonas sp.]